MLSYICASFNQNNKKQTKMKKFILVAVVAGMTALVSCGDGGAAVEAARVADSTRIADSNAVVMAADEEATRVADSVAAAAPVKGK
jgi:Na+-transporting methylmalonyl-CoA/oxaloacetate decarboxylase gamma subunit